MSACLHTFVVRKPLKDSSSSRMKVSRMTAYVACRVTTPHTKPKPSLTICGQAGIGRAGIGWAGIGARCVARRGSSEVQTSLVTVTTLTEPSWPRCQAACTCRPHTKCRRDFSLHQAISNAAEPSPSSPRAYWPRRTWNMDSTMKKVKNLAASAWKPTIKYMMAVKSRHCAASKGSSTALRAR